MKIEKILMLMMACSMLIASSINVAAVEESGILDDGPPGDVFDYGTYELVTENQYIDVDNIDIAQVEYTITNETIEFTMTVVGVIEDRGSLDEIDPDAVSLNIDTVTYAFDLTTSEESGLNMISISYANNTCQVIDALGTITNLTESDFSVNGNTLTVSFDWNTTGQTFEEVTANVQYMRFMFDLGDLSEDDLEDLEESGIVYLVDIVPNGPLHILYTEVTNLGEVGEPVEFDGAVMDGQPPYEINWDFGDGETSTELDTTHTYDTAGKYVYNLTVTDAGGTSENSSGNIEIIGDDDNGTPGFELIIAITAIGLIFLWKRKR